MTRLRHFVFLIALLPLANAELHAQSPQDDYRNSPVQMRDFDREKWQKLTKDLDYSEKEEPEKKPEETVSEAPSTGISDSFAEALKAIFILFGIALLVFIFVKMAGGERLFSRSNPNIKGTNFTLEQIEANLLEADLDDPIRRAVAVGDYPLAIRLHYLSILKELSLKDRIRWRREKTNGEYLRELAGTALHQPVSDVTLIFERIWYGKTGLDREGFLLLESKFKSVAGSI